MLIEDPKIRQFGENSILIEWANLIDTAQHQSIVNYEQNLIKNFQNY